MKKLYCEFLREYENLNHMGRIPVEDTPSSSVVYYMPHHGIFKPDKSSTKLRVVFNASAPTTTGKSLNDILLSGEVKEDLFNILIRFRKHKVALTADITKMFRQILIDPSQRDLLRILWKDYENNSTIAFRMNTVTYGTKCAPFLAIRCLKQLALDERDRFPLAAKAILSDSYMDDIVTGSPDYESAIELKNQLIEIFSSCEMTLHKWNSDLDELLNDNETEDVSFCSKLETSVKTLGMVWQSNKDQFVFRVSVEKQESYIKRQVLSVIAKLYDPLGLIGPIICKAKCYLRKLWLSKIGWDENILESLATDWCKFVNQLKDIENIKISRYILALTTEAIFVLGLADASITAYGAVIYVYSANSSNSPSSNLVASKSRVAPLKTISVPRLELCSCLLLSQLVSKVLPSLKLNIQEVILCLDSTIALPWINTSAHLLKTVIGNRVPKIQSLIEQFKWRHISSNNNPADIISRGTNPQELLDLELWWHGPLMPNNLIDSPDIKKN